MVRVVVVGVRCDSLFVVLLESDLYTYVALHTTLCAGSPNPRQDCREYMAASSFDSNHSTRHLLHTPSISNRTLGKAEEGYAPPLTCLKLQRILH